MAEGQAQAVARLAAQLAAARLVATRLAALLAALLAAPLLGDEVGFELHLRAQVPSKARRRVSRLNERALAACTEVGCAAHGAAAGHARLLEGMHARRYRAAASRHRCGELGERAPRCAQRDQPRTTRLLRTAVIVTCTFHGHVFTPFPRGFRVGRFR